LAARAGLRGDFVSTKRTNGINKQSNTAGINWRREVAAARDLYVRGAAASAFAINLRKPNL
jgi:hypothetical protein